jgi:hypothetical protein
MVAMNAGRHRGRRQVAGHELEKGHLRRGVLHSYPIRVELEVRLAANIASIVGAGQERFLWIGKMRIEDLLCKCKRSVGSENPAYLLELLQEFGVWWCSQLDIVSAWRVGAH